MAVVLRRCPTILQTSRFFTTSNASVDKINSPTILKGAEAFPCLQVAWREVLTLPEVSNARSSGSPALSGAELTRARAILVQAKANPVSVAIVAHLEALNCHARGLFTAEMRARTATVDALLDSSSASVLGDEQSPLISAAASARAVASLRGFDSSFATSAASFAANHAVCPHTRLTAELCGAASQIKDEESAARARLSAITALAPSGEKIKSQDPDLGGLARAIGATTESSESNDELRGLVVRWDSNRPATFDYVEALVATGKAITRESISISNDDERRKRLESEAEDFLAKALEVSGTIGNELDKAEALLAIAQLYARKGNIVEAEGLFRSVEERFAKGIERDAITVSAAGVYVRTMNAYGQFLENSEFAGNKRTKEAELVRTKEKQVRETFKEILDGNNVAPLWVVDSLLPSLEMPLDSEIPI